LQHISTQEIEEEKRAQALLTAELVGLTGILKQATIQMNNTVVEQNMVRSHAFLNVFYSTVEFL
jgi:hypothetical protein